MKVLDVTSLQNPRVKGIAALGMKKHRHESGLFVAEGLQLVGFGVEAGWALETLVVSEDVRIPGCQDARDAGGKTALLARLEEAAGEVLRVSAAVMEKISRKDNPQGVIGVFAQQGPALNHVRVEGVWVVLEEVRDPGNLGTIIRTVDAVGAQGVMLVGDCTDVFAPECVRATMGSIFHVPVVRCRREEFLAWHKGFTGTMVGTHLKGTRDYRSLGNDRPLLLAMGTEQSGLSDTLSAACNALVKIPMRGKAESLNLAMATGILLYEVERANLNL